MTPFPLSRRLGVALLLAAAMLAATPAAAVARGSSGDVFPALPLMPGQSDHGHIDVTADGAGGQPYFRAVWYAEGCSAGRQCVQSGPSLGSEIDVTFSDSSGQTWSGHLDDLIRGITLPGGTLAAGTSRHYDVAASLPVSAGNSFQDRTASLSWVVSTVPSVATAPTSGASPGPATSGASTPTTAASTVPSPVTRGQSGTLPTTRSSVPMPVTRFGARLPFTGVDVIRAGSTALVLILVGCTAHLLGRRRS